MHNKSVLFSDQKYLLSLLVAINIDIVMIVMSEVACI